MRRWGVPTALVVGVLSLAVATGRGQTPDERIVQIDTFRPSGSLYHLSGGGGNAVALVDDVSGGVILVDSKSPGWGQPVLDAVGLVTDLPVSTIINTHAHPDHAGGNPEIATATRIIAHENTKAHMARMDTYAGANAARLPTTTFADRFSLLEGPDRIELYYFGPAHTDGDVIVVFPDTGMAYVGDLFPAKAVPVIDTEHGGSGVAFPETLAKAVAGIDGVAGVITGHSPFPPTYAGRGRREPPGTRRWAGGLMTWDDLAEYADFTRDLLAAVETAFEAGQNVDDAVAALALPPRYQDYGMDGARAAVEAIYGELAAR